MKRLSVLLLTVLAAIVAYGAYAAPKPRAPAVHRSAVGAPTCVAGAAGVAPTATISFTAPTTNTDGTPVVGPLSYQVFTGSASGGETLLGTITTTTDTITAGLKPGTTLYAYVVTKDANGNLSANSNEVCKSFPASVPGTVTITIT